LGANFATQQMRQVSLVFYSVAFTYCCNAAYWLQHH